MALLFFLAIISCSLHIFRVILIHPDPSQGLKNILFNLSVFLSFIFHSIFLPTLWSIRAGSDVYNFRFIVFHLANCGHIGFLLVGTFSGSFCKNMFLWTKLAPRKKQFRPSHRRATWTVLRRNVFIWGKRLGVEETVQNPVLFSGRLRGKSGPLHVREMYEGSWHAKVTGLQKCQKN